MNVDTNLTNLQILVSKTFRVSALLKNHVHNNKLAGKIYIIFCQQDFVIKLKRRRILDFNHIWCYTRFPEWLFRISFYIKCCCHHYICMNLYLYQTWPA